MRCPRCNHWLKSDDHLCPKCGLEVVRLAKIPRSIPMKRMMAVIFVSIGVFAAGAFIAIGAPSVGLPLVIAGGIGVVASSWAYLVLEYKHVKRLQMTADYSVTPLPKEIVKLKLSAGFIYPDIKRVLPDEYQKMISAGWEQFLVEVCYNGSMVMQFINVPDKEKDEFENIGIFFYPYLYEDEALTDRFIKSDAILYFDHKIYSDEGTAAYFGDDLKKAMRVASFVLATVYNIPLDAQLTINVDAR